MVPYISFDFTSVLDAKLIMAKTDSQFYKQSSIDRKVQKTYEYNHFCKLSTLHSALGNFPHSISRSRKETVES